MKENTINFQLKETTNRRKLFNEIFWQEFLGKPEDKVAVQQRKQDLLYAEVVEFIIKKGAKDIRDQLQSELNQIITKNNKQLTVLDNHKNKLNQNSIRFNSRDTLTASDLIVYDQLSQKLKKTDQELVEDSIETMLNDRSKKTELEHIRDFYDTKKDRYKKWGSTAFRGMGTALGAVVGGILGTVLFPGLGTGVGAGLGMTIGGVIGLFVLGPGISDFIVQFGIPLSRARKQSLKIKKYRIASLKRQTDIVSSVDLQRSIPEIEPIAVTRDFSTRYPTFALPKKNINNSKIIENSNFEAPKKSDQTPSLAKKLVAICIHIIIRDIDLPTIIKSPDTSRGNTLAIVIKSSNQKSINCMVKMPYPNKKYDDNGVQNGSISSITLRTFTKPQNANNISIGIKLKPVVAANNIHPSRSLKAYRSA